MKDIENLTREEREVIAARREYKRRWRQANPDKVKAANRRFYLRQAEKLAAEKENEKPSE